MSVEVKMSVDTTKLKMMVESGITLNDMSKYFGVSVEDLVKDYNGIIHRCLVDRNIEVAHKVYELAIDGNLSACQFWLKNVGKWEDYAKSQPNVQPEKIFEAINIRVFGKDVKKDEVLEDDQE